MTISQHQNLKIAVIGSCQVIGISATLQRALPGATVNYWHLDMLSDEVKKDLLQHLPTYDHIITQIPQISCDPDEMPAKNQASLTTGFDSLGCLCESVLYLPRFVFAGFHPDFSGLWGITGPFLYIHSTIIAAGYVFGLKKERLRRLLNPIVFQELGYYDAFNQSKAILLETFKVAGYNLSNSLDQWIEKIGVFTYTPNHPRIEILSTLALMAADKLGVPVDEDLVIHDIPDTLAHSVRLPTYAGFLRQLGIPTSGDDSQLPPDTENQNLRKYSLDELIATYYSFYSTHIDSQAIRKVLPNKIQTVMKTILFN